MINKYQFLNNTNKIRTIASVFVSGDIGSTFTDTNNLIDIYLSYAKLDASGNILNFYPYDGSAFEERKYNNNFTFLNQGFLITGYTIVQDLLVPYSDAEKNSYIQNATDNIVGTSPNIKLGATFEDVEENDTFLNISLERNVNLLETLTIKNNVLGEWNQIDSPTGVVFGTLLATQKLKDDNGNFIKIPLRNVPIMIFNQTLDNPTTTQPSNDNSRIAVNMIENSNRDLYPNDFAYNFDSTILPSVSTKNVTDMYKYSTITNDKGEFILKDVPTGVRTLILEIDLLKQGLTQEEVELNVAPYPKSNDLTPEQVPHLIYREVPIQVLPSWGTINTGYTRVDISMNIDLRKWSTYFVPPVTTYGKTYDEILQAGFQPQLNIRVRNMAGKGTSGQIFPTTDIECVVIPDITKRDTTRLLGWLNETRQLRDLVTFNNLSFNAFKLPANIYDPDAYKTDGSGNTTSDKGVWLSSYEFKVFFNNEASLFRATGFYLGNPIAESRSGATTLTNVVAAKSNFDLNNNNTSSTGVTLGVFPYEKPWTVNYPTRYSIPKIPNKLNTGKQYADDGTPLNVVAPKYLDGDRVGAQTVFNNITFGGWGAQSNDSNDVYPNYFAQQVATTDLYRYEAAISPLDEFSNGYTPNYTFGNVPSNQNASVINGELYQRTECGHAYFIWLQGYPRVMNLSTYDELYPVDFLKNYQSSVAHPYYDSYLKDNNLFNDDTLLATDFVQIKDYQKGYAYLYKITNPDPNTLAPPQPPILRRAVKLNFQNTYIQRGGTDEKARAVLGTSDKNHRFKFRYFSEAEDDTKNSAIFRIKNTGIVSASINVGTDIVKISDGDSYDFVLNDIVNMGSIELPTNDSFDFSLNTYYTTNYEMSIHNMKYYTPNGHLNKTVKDLKPSFGVNDGTNSFNSIKLSGNTKIDGITEYFLVSKVKDIRVRGPIGKSKPDGLVIDCNSESDIQGLMLISSDSTYVETFEFRLNNITPDGGNGENLPYHVLNT